MKEIVLITGANGLIARELSKRLEKEYTVRFLTRKKQHANEFEWNLKNGTVDENAFENISHVIHLAGAGVAEKRWTGERKKEIISSRVDTARLILKTLQKNNRKLKSFISASGINYYGTETTEKIFTEQDAPGNDFLSEVTVLWEQAADKFRDQHIAERVVKLRTGVVLSEKEGALKKMLPPLRAGIGSPLGTGNQYMPWIHIHDICSMYEFALQNPELHGAFNAVAPEHATNRDLTEQAAEILKKPLFMPNVPSFVLKLIFGELSVAVLEGSRASCEKIQNAGFQFEFPHLKEALKDLLKN
ncbi:TIGR01777 family oxidoreductase [Chryseobacterium hagamense]|uniref:NAD-dependent epimerase n=1 Tax=Chryseobacterium hagamense TaxID=395935 RepID=A0A511YHV7_9FLAO|nr:TIGR01777 family oxidoreductase [Chryseobacterium hagamense]GEN74779.1 NAD-dependent epimerase [Chryseobacterium hagamense]